MNESIIAEKKQVRKIIHIDMDCFYAAIEIRDNPSLADKPVAVGAPASSRGVLCTSNYIARQYGVRSAMPTATALRLCKDLILLPVNMEKYKEVARRIHRIFHQYSNLVEPLALDEAYIDVTNSDFCNGSATLIAQEIRNKIREAEQLTASAGVAPNKFLAKIASGWKKPNGLFVIRPEDIKEFVKKLPVEDLFGVGKVTADKLHRSGFKTCSDLQKMTLSELKDKFGKLGQHLYEQCRGIDHRQVIPNRERKSLSVEHTFPKDINDPDICLAALKVLHEKLLVRLQDNLPVQPIRSQFIKIKFNNFRQVTSETSASEINFNIFKSMFVDTYARIQNPVRLLGVGIHFCDKDKQPFYQETLSL
jgi:DNA polymerase-4